MMMCLCVLGREWIREKVEGEVRGAQRSQGHPGALSALKCIMRAFRGYGSCGLQLVITVPLYPCMCDY